MCGRYSFTKLADEVAKRFKVQLSGNTYRATYNGAPTMQMPVVSNQAPRLVSFMRWGLVPHWARDIRMGNRLINARAESLTEKPAFRKAFQRQRCLVISDGFFEWKKNGKKQPYRIELLDGGLFAMAGLWDRWTDPKGHTLQSFTIVTTQANEQVLPIHHRMPVILLPDQEQPWLFSDNTQELDRLLQPYPANCLKTFRVSDRVNSVRNNQADLIQPLASPPSLF